MRRGMNRPGKAGAVGKLYTVSGVVLPWGLNPAR